MKKTTYRILSHIPVVDIIVQILCDPMLFSTPMLMDGLPSEVRDYMVAHPDTFITKRLYKEIMSDKSKH